MTGAWTLIFDGDCAFCRRCVATLARWDRRGVLRFVPFQDQAALDGLPPISRGALERAMHLVGPDRRVAVGAAAGPALLGVLPGGSVFAALFAFPGAAWLADRTYRFLARHRHRLNCGSSVCQRGR